MINYLQIYSMLIINAQPQLRNKSFERTNATFYQQDLGRMADYITVYEEEFFQDWGGGQTSLIVGKVKFF